MFWEVSHDGSGWTTRAQADQPFDVDKLRIVLGGSSTLPLGADELMEVDNLNLPP